MIKQKSRIIEGIKHPKTAVDTIYKIIDRRMSKPLFQNSAGLTHNVSGHLSMLTKKQISLENDNSMFASKMANLFQEQGYVKLGSLHDVELINEISKQFHDAVDNEIHSYAVSKFKNEVYSKGVYRGFEVIPKSLDLINDEVSNVVKQYYKTNFTISRFNFYRNYHVPDDVLKKTEIFSDRWHCDPCNTTWIKLFVYLTDVTELDGPFHVKTKNETKKLMKMGFGTRHNLKISEDILEDESSLWKATGNRGSSLMCNCNLGLHKAGVPEYGRFRDVIMIQFSPSNEPFNKNEWLRTFEDADEPKLRKI